VVWKESSELSLGGPRDGNQLRGKKETLKIRRKLLYSGQGGMETATKPESKRSRGRHVMKKTALWGAGSVMLGWKAKKLGPGKRGASPENKERSNHERETDRMVASNRLPTGNKGSKSLLDTLKTKHLWLRKVKVKGDRCHASCTSTTGITAHRKKIPAYCPYRM